MQLTRIRMRQCHNKIRQFRYYWHYLRKKKMAFSGEKEVLQARGITVLSSEDFLSDAVSLPKREDFFPKPPPPSEPMETLYLIGPEFSPMLGQCMNLAQNLSWSVVTDQLPQMVLDRKRELVTEDRELVEQDILSSHLLDNWEEKLVDPRNFELPNKLEKDYNIYTIPMHRKNALLSHSLVQTLDHTSLDPLSMLARPHLHNTTANCTFRYDGSLVQLALAVPLMVGALAPLPQVVPPSESHLFIPPELDEKTKRMIMRKQMQAEVGGPLQQPLPTVAPLEPFIGAQQLDQYTDARSRYLTSAPGLYPHTLHIHHNAVLRHLDLEQLTSLTLMQLYSCALTYALHAGIKVNSSGHLSRPVVVQGVHSHLNLFQPAVFQLNTLGPHVVPVTDANLAHVTPEDSAQGSHLRNVFFYRPFDKLYHECKYVVAKPTLSGVNAELISIIRALHEG